MGRTLILLLQLLSLAAAASNLSSCGCQQELTGLEAKILKMEAKILKMEAEFTRQIENLKAVRSKGNISDAASTSTAPAPSRAQGHNNTTNWAPSDMVETDCFAEGECEPRTSNSIVSGKAATPKECLERCENVEGCYYATWMDVGEEEHSDYSYWTDEYENCELFTTCDVITKSTCPTCLTGITRKVDSALLIGGTNSTVVSWSPKDRTGLSCQANAFALSSLPAPVGTGNRAAVLDNTVFACGGSEARDGCFVAHVHEESSWRRGQDMTEARSQHTLTRVGHHLVATGGITAGGVLSKSVEIYTLEGGWRVADWSLVRPTADHCAVAISDTELVILSGNQTMEVRKYDLTKTRSKKLKAPTGIDGGPYTCVTDNRKRFIYVLGHIKGTATKHNVWRYDNIASTWERMADLSVNKTTGHLPQMAMVAGEVTVFSRDGVQVLRNSAWQPAQRQLDRPYQHAGLAVTVV